MIFSQIPFLCSLLLAWIFFQTPLARGSEFKEAISFYSQGKYQKTIEELNRLETLGGGEDSKRRGLIAFWKGISFGRLGKYQEAESELKKALNLHLDSPELHYELGQAQFSLDHLKEAKIHFSESFKRNFKRETSLYYMAFISKELDEKENAKSLFEVILKNADPETLDVRQASLMQLGDMELAEVENKPNVFREVDEKVIPLYKKAEKLNPESSLSGRIKEKIINLQKKYELVLFQLRNGRPTQIPPIFLRLAQEIGVDSNVTFTPTETTTSSSREASLFSKTDFTGRYTFYYKNFLSYAPELRWINSYYFNRVPEIYRNDNYVIAPALRLAHEHMLWKNPASTLFDYEFNYSERDVKSQKKLTFNSHSHALTLGERFKYFSQGETTLRLRQRFFRSFLTESNSKALGLSVEQILSLKSSTLIFFSSFDSTKVEDSLFDTNALTLRGDWAMPMVKNWFTPSLSFALTLTDPVNNRSRRGRETLINPSLRLSRHLGKNWRANSRFEYHRNHSKDKTSFDYKKNLMGVELEYLF